MGRPAIQFSLTAMLGLIACIALNLWLFRLGLLAGFIGLNVTKHVGVAVLCQALGVDGKQDGGIINRQDAKSAKVGEGERRK